VEDDAMKITVDIDCTPEEMRRAFGLPDVQPMNEVVVAELQAKLTEAVRGLDPEKAWSAWAAPGMQGLEQMQRLWGDFMARTAPKSGPKGGRDV
jgi:hypothetical protein